MPKLEANIVIIGGGGAGIVAALTAAEKGASDIMVLEKRLAPGGNSALAGGYLFAAESPPQKRANAKISRDAIFKETMAFHHYDRVNGRVIRAFIDKTGDTLTWSLDTNATWLSINPITGNLSGIPKNTDVGVYYVNVFWNPG